jgi:hypothetical protein
MTEALTATLIAAPSRAPSALRVGDVFTQAQKIFFAHWASYGAIMAVGYAPFGAAIVMARLVAAHPALARGPTSQSTTIAIGIAAFVGVIAAFLGLLLAPAAINYGVTQDITGRGFSLSASAGAALRRSPAVIGLSLLIALYGGLAALLLIVPGLIVFTIYAVAIPACMAERIGPLRAMSRSAFLTKGNRWRVFGLLAALYILGAIFEQMVASAASIAIGALPSLVIALPFDVGVAAFSAVVVAVLYAHLRTAREGIDIEHIAKVFD